MKKIGMCAVLLVTIASFSFADLFNSKLSGAEREKLANGEVVIRNIDKMKNICITERPETQKVIKTMKDLGPNYTAEIIQIRPYEGNENLRDVIKDALLDIPDYAGIPYYSVRAEKWYELYDSAVITEQTQSEDGMHIRADLEMDPFGTIKADIHLEETPDFLYYDMTNLNKLRYKGEFTAVKANRMKSAITVFRDGDNWVLYAIGGVDTYKIFFLEDRVETSFINRIKTFCNYIFTKI